MTTNRKPRQVRRTQEKSSAQFSHSECPPGAPCCAHFHADRQFFEDHPQCNFFVRDMYPAEFDGVAGADGAGLGPGSLVLVQRIDALTNARIPIPADRALAFLRYFGGFRHDH